MAMRIGVTGAGGFVGSALVSVLAKGDLKDAGLGVELVAIDAQLPTSLPEAIERAEGDLADTGFLEQTFSRPFDVFYHLAAIPGGAAARDYDLGWRVNVEASVAVLKRLALQEKPARFVFASSIGVFGIPLPTGKVNDETLPLPTMSYGAQKLIVEALVADFWRRGLVDGLAVRLPGIIARPRVKGGHLSAYMSDILHTLRAGEPFVCPVSADATSWFMSRARCVENLIHAGSLPAERLGTRRAFNLPALTLSMRALVDGAAGHFGPQVQSLVTYEPNEALQAQFGSYPALLTPIADGLGFTHDGDAKMLVARALDLSDQTSQRGAA
ncbi:NAD-dependent epimerase/dehydratase family protein [Rhizobium sp. ICMP 5592]|nr:NAD-dependent epimerase/dehydratase family protein [Rhizobium sp. ICMP 5592]